MKNILTAIAFSILLAGCGNSAAPESAESAATPDNSAISNTVALTDDTFVDLSARILCLPTNNPDASSVVIENSAKQILADAGVGEDDFKNYQKTIEADAASKSEISLAIVGRMSDFCTLEISPDAPTENPAE